MVYIDRDILREEFVYDGLFYTTGQDMIPPDGSLFGDGDGGEVEVLRTKCDVIETNRSFASGSITANYDVYFPIPDDGIVPVERGMNFRCDTSGLTVSGLVVSVGVSRLGKAHAYIRCTEI